MTPIVTMLEPLPEQNEFEREIREFLNDGDITHTARYLQMDRTQVSKMLNPDCPDRHNPFWLTLGLLWAFDAQRDHLADNVLDSIVRRRMQWLPRPVALMCPAKATSNIGAELMDLIEKELAGYPNDDLLKEAMDIRNAVEVKIQEILARRGI